MFNKMRSERRSTSVERGCEEIQFGMDSTMKELNSSIENALKQFNN